MRIAPADGGSRTESAEGRMPEPEGGLEGEGFAVDPDLDGAGRPDLELRAAHSSKPEYRLP